MRCHQTGLLFSKGRNLLITTVLEHIAFSSSLPSVGAIFLVRHSVLVMLFPSCHQHDPLITSLFELRYNCIVMLVQLFKVPRTAKKIMICVNDPVSASCRAHTCTCCATCILGQARPVDIWLQGPLDLSDCALLPQRSSLEVVP